jgi:hypothetical protein
MDIILINDDFPSENGEIPLPDWSAFDDADLTDLDEGAARRTPAAARRHRPSVSA